MRASGSSIRKRVIAELSRLRAVGTMDTKFGRIAIPDDLKRRTTTCPVTWGRTCWRRNTYQEPSAERPGEHTTSMFTSNAPELQHIVLTRITGFQFTGAQSRIELAAQITDYVHWAQECAPLIPTNFLRIMPLSLVTPVHVGTSERHGRAENSEGTHHAQLSIYATVSKIQNLGVAASILLQGSRLVHRNSGLRGKALVDAPQHL